MSKTEPPKPFTWSYSKLSLYEKCPAQFRYRYIQNLPTPKGAAASRGTEIHQSIENYLLGKAGSDTLHESVQKYADLFAGIKAKKPSIEEKLAFSESWEVVPWTEGWLRLAIDSYYIESKEAVVQEWKSGKVYDDHEEQRKLYGTTLMLKHPELKRASVKTIYTDQNKAVKVVYERHHVEDVVDDFERRVSFMRYDDEMAPRPGWYCRFCAFTRMGAGPCKVG
jgi:CRISPR/Cas system-associated exonuclease Cas4 (RecB family)